MSRIKFPQITFGMIVLNGEPFLRYNLRSLYSFAHQIIVVEGAAPGAAYIATDDGHSTDGTLETLHDFRAHDDPEDKVTIITAEDVGHPDGFWPGEKHEQSQAYAKQATGDFLWQVDVDEFYKPEDIRQIVQMLHDDPGITAASFKMITFWGGFDYITDGWYLRRGAEIYHRLFRWGEGYEYVTHRPPTVKNPQGQNVRNLHWVSGQELAKTGIVLYHYSLLFPNQVLEKCRYYQRVEWVTRNKAEAWVNDCYLKLGNPYRVHNVYDFPSWLDRYEGIHPPEIEALKNDISAGKIQITPRLVDDIEAILGSWRYTLGRTFLKLLIPFDRFWHNFLLTRINQAKKLVKEIFISQ